MTIDKIVIFDLDGTLADITARRVKSTKDNGKMDWSIFFDPDITFKSIQNLDSIRSF